MVDKHLKRKTVTITVDHSRSLKRTNMVRDQNPSNVVIINNPISNNNQISNGVVVQPKNRFVANGKNKLIRQKENKSNFVGTQRISKEIDAEQKRQIKRLENKSVGKSILILGNGPSLNLIDTTFLSTIENLELCTINVPDKRCWPTKYWAFYDISQFNMHRELYDSYGGTIFNSTTIKGNNPNSIKFKHISGLGYSRNAVDGIYVGMSSVYATIQIAMYMNFDNIFVVGCDMSSNVDKSQTHFYGVNPRVKPDVRLDRFKKEANWYDRMVDALNTEERVKITFCSRGINKWRFVDYFNNIEPEKTLEYINDKIS